MARKRLLRPEHKGTLLCKMPILANYIADNPPHVIQKTASVLEAAKRMTAENVGALVILDGDKLVGIFTERDLMKKIVAQGKDPAKSCVADEMTAKVALGTLSMTVEEALRTMKQAKCRHLPIVDQGKLMATVSIRDLIEVDWREKKDEVRWMKEYIQYAPPGS